MPEDMIDALKVAVSAALAAEPDLRFRQRMALRAMLSELSAEAERGAHSNVVSLAEARARVR